MSTLSCAVAATEVVVRHYYHPDPSEDTAVALVRRLEPAKKERYSVHALTECAYSSFESGGRSYLQLDSYGKPGRKRPGQISQSFQFDEAAASQLKKIIEKAFPKLGVGKK